MKHRVLPLVTFVWLFATTFSVNADTQNGAFNQSSRKEMAVTFDDLPVVSSSDYDQVDYQQITAKLIKSISLNKVPAIGFVNEDKLISHGELDEARVALLRMWLDAGLELGNHTFSHLDLHTTPLPMYQGDVIRGEWTTSLLLREKGMKLRYFRHPYLHTGRNIETKEKLEEFLAGRGYRIAPVTIINSDWIFAASYKDAFKRGDKVLRKRIAEVYIPYTEQVVEYFERQSIDLFGYEVKQVLLLHANRLNADYFDDLVLMMRRHGYAFITLDQALQDKAYESADTYTGLGGISWLHRWAITKGVKSRVFPDELVITEYVIKQSARPAQRLPLPLRRILIKFWLLHTLAGVMLLLALLYLQSRRAFRSWKGKILG